MSLHLENLIKPFSIMSQDEQEELVRKVRHNRFTIQPSKVKVAKAKVERKEKNRSKEKAKSLLANLSPEERKALLLKVQEEL